MLNPANPHPTVEARQPEVDPLPLFVALAVIGPFAIAVALALLVAVAG